MFFIVKKYYIKALCTEQTINFKEFVEQQKEIQLMFVLRNMRKV